MLASHRRKRFNQGLSSVPVAPYWTTRRVARCRVARGTASDMTTSGPGVKSTDVLTDDVGTTIVRGTRRVDWPLGLGVGLLAGLIAWYLRGAVPQFLSYDPARYGAHLWQRRLVFLPHFIGAAAALFLGLTQLWLGLSGRHGALHRTLGRLYLVTVACACAGGCTLAAMILSQALVFASGFFFMGCAW